MKLTKKKALELSIELWTWLAETGKHKYEWNGWSKYGNIFHDCFLCEYGIKQSTIEADECDLCSYYQRFGYCCLHPSPYTNWDDALTTEEHKKYAQEFLEQLKQL